MQAGYNRAVEKMQQDEFGRLRGRVYAGGLQRDSRRQLGLGPSAGKPHCDGV